VTSNREREPDPHFRLVSHDAGAPGGSRGLPFTDLALEQLRTWPALEVTPPGPGPGAAVRVRGPGTSIARLHHPGTAELCLTWPVIQRLADALTATGRIRISPGSDWIRLPLEGTSDVRLLLLLMSVAIQAHAARAGPGPEPS